MILYLLARSKFGIKRLPALVVLFGCSNYLLAAGAVRWAKKSRTVETTSSAASSKT